MTGSPGDARTTSAPPVFVVGADRSGTSLLRVMLDRHPELSIPGEGHFIPDLWARRARYGPDGRVDDVGRFFGDLAAHPTFRFWSVPIDEVRRELAGDLAPTFAEAIEAAYLAFAHRKGKRRWGDKTPAYVDHIPLLAQLFPTARFIHMIRDGRDVALSTIDLHRMHRRSASCALMWRRKIRRGEQGASLLGPERYTELYYEALVDDPERELRRLCGFLDLAFDTAMLEHDDRAVEQLPEKFRSMHTRLSLPPTKGLRDWRRQMAQAEVEEFEAIAGPELRATGYELATDRVRITTGARAWLHVGGFGARYVWRQVQIKAGRRRRPSGRQLPDRA